MNKPAVAVVVVGIAIVGFLILRDEMQPIPGPSGFRRPKRPRSRRVPQLRSQRRAS